MNEKTGLEHYEKLYGDLNLPPDDAAKWIFLSGWNSAMGEAMRRVNSMPFGDDTRASFAVYFQQMMVLDPEAAKETFKKCLPKIEFKVEAPEIMG
jgi:hypothetical protein